jgi:hypothetical protein
VIDCPNDWLGFSECRVIGNDATAFKTHSNGFPSVFVVNDWVA